MYNYAHGFYSTVYVTQLNYLLISQLISYNSGLALFLHVMHEIVEIEEFIQTFTISDCFVRELLYDFSC